MNHTDELGTAEIRPLFFKLTVPAVVAQVISLLYNIVDRIYIGHMGDAGQAALTGAGLFVPILLLINAFAMLVSSGGAPLMSIRLGEGDRERAEKLMGNCLSALLLFSVLLTAALYAAAPRLLRFFGASDATFPYALSYARIYILGTVFVMLSLGMNYFISAQGFARESMLTNIIGAVINIVLDPILIFGFDMGVRGAAIATVFSQAVSAVWVLRFLLGRRTGVLLRPGCMKLEAGALLPCLGLGVSSFIMVSTESLLSMTFNHSLARYGSDIAVGAMTIISSVSSLVNMPMHGVAQGASPIISYNFGALKRERVKQGFRLIFLTCVGCASAGCVLILLFPRVIAGIFTPDAELLDYSAWAMRIYFAGTFAFGFQVACQQSFVALGQAKISLLMACLRKLVLLIPLILLLPHLTADPVLGIFLAEPISDVAAAAVTTTLFFRRFDRILARGPAWTQNR